MNKEPSETWQQQLKSAYRHPAALLKKLGISGPAPTTPFQFLVTQSYASRIKPNDPTDPLLRQILPSADELIPSPGFSADPVGDHHAFLSPGILKKYHGRVLLLVSSNCAVNCRFCFRREYPYATSASLSPHEAIHHLAQLTNIHEVILSGGDPLLLTTRKLSEWYDALHQLPSLKRIRIHSRIPIALPDRLNDSLCKRMKESTIPTVMVIHCNHPNEIDSTVKLALKKLAAANVSLLNQSVLLKGVNDTAETLSSLSEKLFSSGVLPYYLHMLDRVTGAAHFEVSESAATKLVEQLRIQLPGYLVPKLVRERSGEPYKTPIV